MARARAKARAAVAVKTSLKGHESAFFHFLWQLFQLAYFVKCRRTLLGQNCQELCKIFVLTSLRHINLVSKHVLVLQTKIPYSWHVTWGEAFWMWHFQTLVPLGWPCTHTFIIINIINNDIQGDLTTTAAAPNRPAIGSTIPLSWPYLRFKRQKKKTRLWLPKWLQRRHFILLKYIFTLKLLICQKNKSSMRKNKQAYNSQKISYYFYRQLNQNTPKTLPWRKSCSSERKTNG